MDKLDCVYNYFKASRSYYLFHLGVFLNEEDYLNYILEKENIIGAKVSFISNIMLGIKEDLVNTKGANDYRSKIFLDNMEKLVSLIATKTEDGYKLSNYTFPDAATLVAIIRNKFAHGKYIIDFNHNRVILNHKGVDIVINIDKLTEFIMIGFMNTIHNVSSNTYERNLVYLVKEDNKIKNGRIKDINEVKKIIKSYNCVKFKLTSLNGFPILKDCIDYFNSFLKIYNYNPYQATKSNYFKQMEDYLKSRNCKIDIEYSRLNNKDEIDKIASFVEKEVLENNNLTYERQLLLIGSEVQRSVENKFNNFNPISANINNLILLDAISKVKSVNREVISDYIGNVLGTEVKFDYDEYASVLLSMFNSLFIYPFDDVFETTGEYKIDRKDSFDFSNLDLSMVNPSIINIDNLPLSNIEERRNNLIKKMQELSSKIDIQKNNLTKVKNNSTASVKINENIVSLQKSLVLTNTKFTEVDTEYNSIKNDYTINRLHFENRSIIEGIRNCIAHGNYEVVIDGNFSDTKIIFNNIYEGNTMFKLTVSFEDFECMIEENYNVVLNYTQAKSKIKKLIRSKHENINNM